MPYIKEERREKIFESRGVLEFDKINIDEIENSGELNYAITEVLKNFVNGCGRNYKTLNEVVGVLECVKQEFYRRVVVPYENEKIEENGDIY